MSIVLFRVDERLIHGQVVLGWGSQLRPGRFVVLDDELADSPWEQDLYRLGAGEAEVVFASVDEARERLDRWEDDPVRTIVLTRDPGTMRELARGGRLQGRGVNLGGIHHGPGRTQVLSYVHLSDEDREHLRSLADEGVTVTARDLPDSPAVSLSSLLDR